MKKTIMTVLAAAGLAGAAFAGDAAEESGARAEVYAFLKECPAFFLATDDGGVPRVRPFGALADWDGAIYIQTGKRKAVYRQLVGNPKVEICALKPSGKEWVRIAATAVPDTRREALSAVLDANPGLRSMYSEDDGNTAVFRLEEGTATFNSFTAPPREVPF